MGLKLIKCVNCAEGTMVPQYFREDNKTYVCGLTCSVCLKNEVTSIMTVREFNEILKK